MEAAKRLIKSCNVLEIKTISTDHIMREQKISVVINTYNEERHLEACVKAVQDFDEVLVCDMESTDHTVEIAQRLGCRVVTFPKANHKSAEPARTFAIQSATSPWVLVVDADEIVTPELHDYLYQHIATDGCAEGLYLPRKGYFMHRLFAYPDYQLRFFIREGTEWPPYVHTFPTIKGRIEHIPRKRRELALEHLADDTIRMRLHKTNEYTDNEVEKKRGKHYGMAKLLLDPAWRFFRAYILKGEILKGKAGFINSVLDSYYRFVMIAKIIEAQS